MQNLMFQARQALQHCLIIQLLPTTTKPFQYWAAKQQATLPTWLATSSAPQIPVCAYMLTAQHACCLTEDGKRKSQLWC